jgi:hypothetical protein
MYLTVDNKTLKMRTKSKQQYTDQTMTVLSTLAEANRLSKGPQATWRTSPLWPRSVWRSRLQQIKSRVNNSMLKKIKNWYIVSLSEFLVHVTDGYWRKSGGQEEIESQKLCVLVFLSPKKFVSHKFDLEVKSWKMHYNQLSISWSYLWLTNLLGDRKSK